MRSPLTEQSVEMEHLSPMAGEQATRASTLEVTAMTDVTESREAVGAWRDTARR